MTANKRQVGGEHYKSGIEHWDYVAANDLDYFQGQITKYVARWKDKNGMQDLQKALHFLEKYIELNQPEVEEPGESYVNQDPDIPVPFNTKIDSGIKAELLNHLNPNLIQHAITYGLMIVAGCDECRDEETGERFFRHTYFHPKYDQIFHRIADHPIGLNIFVSESNGT